MSMSFPADNSVPCMCRLNSLSSRLCGSIASFICAVLALSLAACAPLPPQRVGFPAVWQPSPNFDERRPNFVIIHDTTNETADRALRTLTDPVRKVSAHYLIGRDGTIYQLVDERARAWHAGQSRWGATTDLNSVSIGIELDNDGEEPYPDTQIAVLLKLLGDLDERYHIPTANYLGHGDIAPRRKVDPGRYFPWSTLAANGFGVWCDSPLPEAPATLDATLALQAFGYDISNPGAAIGAFKRHFMPDEMTEDWTDADGRMLYCLLGQ